MRRRTTQLLLAFLLAGGIAATAGAQVESVRDLAFPPLPELAIPQPQRTVLPNGMVVMLLEDHELPLINATALVRTGSRLEPADKVGLAELTGEVLRTGGTSSRSPDELDLFLETKAASIESSIDTAQGEVTMSCLAKDFPEVFSAFVDVLRHPAFDEQRLKVAKTGMNAAIARQNDDPTGILSRTFDEVIYGAESPYARTPTYATVAAVDRRDLVAWHERYYHPDRIVLGVVGDFDAKRMLAAIRRAFGDWKKGSSLAAAEAPYRKQPNPGVFFAEKNDMTQSDIEIGHLGIEKDNPDYYAVEVMNEVLSGSFGSRLVADVRTKKGLAYAVHGGVGSGWDHPGTFGMFMTTKVETTGAGIAALIEEARDLTARPPTEQEVARAKASILNSFVFNSDSKRKILGQQLTFEFFGYPLDWLARYRSGIENVTVDAVRRVAAKYVHPGDFSIVVVGPSEGRDEPLETFGKVTQLDISIPQPEQASVEVTAEGRQRGEALIAKAVEGMGGAAAIDGVENVQLTGSSTLETPQGKIDIQASALTVFPDRFRQDLVLPFGKMVMAVTPDGGFMQTPQGVQPMPEARRVDLEKAMLHDPLTVLKRRHAPGFEPVATGSDEVAGTTVGLVAVTLGDQAMTLGIDPASGRVLSLSYQGAGPQGAPGQIVKTFSDFRTVDDGLVLPFTSTQTFNGEPSSVMTLDSVTVNGPVDENAFEAPAQEGKTPSGGTS